MDKGFAGPFRTKASSGTPNRVVFLVTGFSKNVVNRTSPLPAKKTAFRMDGIRAREGLMISMIRYHFGNTGLLECINGNASGRFQTGVTRSPVNREIDLANLYWPYLYGFCTCKSVEYQGITNLMILIISVILIDLVTFW